VYAACLVCLDNPTANEYCVMYVGYTTCSDAPARKPTNTKGLRERHDDEKAFEVLIAQILDFSRLPFIEFPSRDICLLISPT
jgi:hypothetical protein